HVADLVANGVWNWPLSWLAKAPNLGLIAAPNFDNSYDCVHWRDSNGKLDVFSVKLAWEALRPRGLEVSWCNTVWFSHCIPRHAFHLWLIMRRSLKTQDMLHPWDVDPTTDLSSSRCSLVCVYVEMDDVRPMLNDILLWLQPMAAKRTFKGRVGKLILAASSYYIWRERNNRLFKGTRRSPEELRDLIIVTVRLKLVSFRFKNTMTVQRLLALWKMPSNFRVYGD
ncbi:putative reverse transcriptase domain-containing protein, partial [Tanacetum coccineum]